jgi:hypothetical protein
MKYASDVHDNSDTVLAYSMNSTTSTPLLSQKAAVVSILAENVCLHVFSLSCECVCIHSFDCSLVSTFTNETRVLPPVTKRLRNSKSLWYYSKNAKAEAILTILGASMNIFRICFIKLVIA